MKTQGNAIRIGKLWHQCLGHPSNVGMTLVIKNLGLLDCVRNKNNVCEVCFRAKQTRSQFYVSKNKVEDLFEIIHKDIWGLTEYSLFVEHITP